MDDIISLLVEQMARKSSAGAPGVDPAEVERLKQQLAASRAAGKRPGTLKVRPSQAQQPAPGSGWFVPASPAAPAPPSPPPAAAPSAASASSALPSTGPQDAWPVLSPTAPHHGALLGAYGDRSALLAAMVFSEALAPPVALRRPR